MTPPVDDLSPQLVETLRGLGNEYGPLGVALAASLISDPAAVLARLREMALTKPLVYVAAPYTSDPVANTRAAVLQGISLWRTGTITPLIPHLTLLADLLAPMPVEQWYALDCEQLRRCDAVFRMPGASVGADAEVAFAVANGIRVFTDRDALLDWAADR